MNTIEIDKDYLIIAPNNELGLGNHQMLTERAFLADNLDNFLRRYLDVSLDNITVYELKKISIDHLKKILLRK